jgi:hypothetical protein
MADTTQADRPNYPDNPSNIADFEEMVKNKPESWFEYFVKLGTYVNALESEHANLLTQAESWQEDATKKDLEVNRLYAQVAALQAQNSTHLATVNSDRSPATRSQKIPDPDRFNGDRDKLENFRLMVVLKLKGNEDWYPTEQDRLRYIFSRLEGSAQQQVISRVRLDGSIDFTSIEELWTVLERAFGDPDRKGTAQRTIQNLRQKNREFHVYLAEFQRHIEYTGFNEEAKKTALLNGISSELRELLVTQDIENTSLDDTIHVCQRIDQRHRAAQALQRRPFTPRASFGSPHASPRTPATPTPAPLYSPSPITSSSPAELMDLSAARVQRGPLTDAEKRRRREQGLCLYCGDGQHHVLNCPRKPRFASPRLTGDSGTIMPSSTVTASSRPTSPENA